MTSHELESKFLIGYHKPKHLEGSIIDESTTLDISSSNVYNLQNMSYFEIAWLENEVPVNELDKKVKKKVGLT